MFNDFFYELRDTGVPVSPTGFLRLQRALSGGYVNSLQDFYTAARAILVKSERYFDTYDQVFAHYFEGAELPTFDGLDLEAAAKALLEEWLKDPDSLAEAMGLDQEEMLKLTPEELIEYFLQKLKEQTEAHHGGNKWIGTQGKSPVGNAGENPGGMRVGGMGGGMSAVKVAMDRRYKDYSQEGPLTQPMIGEALKRLRFLKPVGPMDEVNIDETIHETIRNGGEIEIMFDRRLKDRLKILLMIDNGGWSMEPFVDIVQTLFDYARDSFKDLKTYYFHNTVYDWVWEHPSRVKKAKRIEDFGSLDPDCRLIFIGDASMAPYELQAPDGSIHIEERNRRPSIEQLRLLAKTFRHSAWLNPVMADRWSWTQTIGQIASIVPMFEFSIDGLEKCVQHLVSKN